MTDSRPARDLEARVIEGSPAEPAFAATVADLLSQGVRVRFRATGASMAPTIIDGDTITVEPVQVGRLRRGDVVLARRGGAVVAHRLVARHRRPDGDLDLLLRGDAADGDDAPVPAGNVVGRVVEVDRVGVRSRPSSWPARLVALARSGARRLRR